MSWIDQFAGWFAERRGFHVSQSPPGWVESIGGLRTAAGTTVSPNGSLEITAVYACVRILAETIASLPLPVYQRLANGGKGRVPDFYLYSLLHDAPNREMTSFELRETLQGHLATWGNAYAELEIDNAGRVRALWPLRPDRMKVTRENRQLIYTYRLPKPDGQGRTKIRLSAYQVLHLRGMGYDGVVGYSPISLARQALGLAQATEEYGAKFFANGARPGVVLEHPGKLSQDAHDRLKESWEERHQGLSNAHRVAVLEEGLSLKEVGLPPQDAQFLETRKFQRNEIAMIYRVPPHMLADLERATFSNIEHQSLEFVVHTIRPWLVRWEQALRRDVFLKSERGQYFAEFLVDGLLRGDIKSRYEAYATGRQNGWLSANDVREMENQNPISGGDMYLVPLNMIPANQVGAGLGSTETEDGRGYRAGVQEQRSAMLRHRLEQAQRPVYADVIARILRRERNDVGQATKKFLARGLFEFERWLEEFYSDHQRWMFDQMMPLARSYGEMAAGAAQEEINTTQGMTPELDAFTRSYLAGYVVRHSVASQAAIRAAIERAQKDERNADEVIQEVVDSWPENRAPGEAQDETVRFGNAIAVTVFAIGGVMKLRWRAFGESCPYCNSLNGRVVGISDFFLTVGMEFEPEGAERPLLVGHNVRHAPAHPGCDCAVTAAL